MSLDLFVYGTLHPDRAPAEIRDVVEQFVFVGSGSVQGRVLDLGEYPGLVLSADPRDRTRGSIFRLPDDGAVLAALDHYEGVDANIATRSLFRREPIEVTCDDGSRKTCWVYLYNWSPLGAP